MGVILLFIDGVGIGTDDPGKNPFAEIEAKRLAPVRDGAPEPGCSFRPLDATLGVPGLPQSATGQTTLFTGVNAARLAGRHLPGLPGSTLRAVLEKDSIFHRLVEAGRKPTFANAYTRAHLEAKRPRWSATTRMALSAGTVLRVLDDDPDSPDLVFHDYSGDWALRHGVAMPQRTAAQAAGILVSFLRRHDLVLYEYFLTDIAGHRGNPEQRRTHAERAEALVDAVIDQADLKNDTVIVVSDHGNLEDGTTRLHTLNPVPLLAWGNCAEEFVDRTPSMESLAGTLVRQVLASSRSRL